MLIGAITVLLHVRQLRGHHFALAVAEHAALQIHVEPSLRAERRLGEMMAVTPKAKGTMGQLKGSEDGSGATAIVVSGGVTDTPPEISFAEAGIDKNLAHRVRLLHGKSKEFSGTRIGDVGMVRYGPLTR